ncbi:winged helix-turn-helix domain-containing protein [Enterobacter ludwigii]|uniref:winged helix-turn-helix domain-containing protein n=1 Tax=Enterobacter ludwigii TaxID=299767 RepID=UPI003D22C6A5
MSLNNDHNICVTISNQANRLLLEMVKRKNEILNRNELIKNVWEDYGFTSSNNSLNVAVSELRKAFSSLGKDPQIISTIPKVGLQFVADVAPVMSHNGTVINATSTPNVHIVASLTKWIVFSLICLTAFFLGVYTYNHFKIKITTEQEYKELAFTRNKCDIYTLGHQYYNVEDIKKNTEQYLKNCELQRSELFYEKVKSGTLFIGACTLNNQGEYLKCITIKK